LTHDATIRNTPVILSIRVYIAASYASSITKICIMGKTKSSKNKPVASSKPTTSAPQPSATDLIGQLKAYDIPTYNRSLNFLFVR
jgi:hypothetical protein